MPFKIAPLVWLVLLVLVLRPCDSTVTPSPSRFVNLTNRTRLIYNEELTDKEILDDLLHKQRYDKRIIPQTSGPVAVNVSVLLLSLASPDESSLKYEVEFLMRQTWTDPRLAFEAGPSHKSLNAIFHHDSIWLPDTYFIKHGDFKQLSPFNIALRVHKNGTVLYIMRRHLILWCQGNLNIFPFDDPVCSFAVESISHEQNSIVYQWHDDEGTIRKTPSLASLNAYLIHNKTTFCPDRSWRGNFSCLTVELTFTRDKPFYFTTVFIPDIFLVTSSFITFWLEWNAVPARVLIGVTTMLNFFTTSNNFRSTLPVVNNLTAMNLWDGVCMCFIYASLLEFVAVNYVGRKRPRSSSAYRRGEDTITQGCVNLTRRIRDKISRLRGSMGQQEDPKREADHELVACTECAADSCSHRNQDKEDRQGLGRNRRDNHIHPVRIAKTIDVISRTVFPSCFAVFLIYFFANYHGTDMLF